ncbi:MAG: hypothetical protein IPL52_03595 [Flavobacteriales bacterium]|nr:hypothetical protein [Flavobacteriales bacterium]
MRRNLLFTLLALRGLFAAGQWTIWGEEFENGCVQGCYASAYVGPNGGWAVTNVGTNGVCANRWFISCQENGGVAGSCGVGCGNNETLHVGNDIACVSPNGCFFCPTGDCGAAYDASCPPALCGFCCSCNSAQTDQRAESPVINLTGFTGMTLSFLYMEGGQAASDNAQVWYYDGAAWALLGDMPKTVVCAGQGTWTNYSVALPASANNNPSVRVGFRWVNNNDGSGADPSIAVDNVQITIPFAPPGTGLIVNELSNGPSLEKEYVELIVVGPACTNVDIRNIKVDDNNGVIFNGFSNALVNGGVSTGHMRFANLAVWSAVPTGSIILIYNNADLNALLPPDDPDDTAPNDKRYILPANHASLQGCSTSPNAGSSSASGYWACAFGAGNWTQIAFRNQGDAAQTRDPQGRYFHGISFGSNGNNMNNGGLDNLRISTLDHTGRVLFFNNGNYRLAANFTSAVVAANETPGAPNNAANAAFIATFDCSLPIELLRFDANAMDDRVRVEWSTASERDNALFVVERSTDAEHYESIGTIPGAGNSLLMRAYIFDDPRPLHGLAYYRLRQVDLDGTTTLSDAVAVLWAQAPPFTATLSVDGLLTIVGAQGPGGWVLCDPLGRMIAEGALGESFEQRAWIGAAPDGLLVLSVRTRNRSAAMKLHRGLRTNAE